MIAMEPIGDQLNIDTPELVAIEMPLAGIGSRFIAILVDYLIWGFVFLVLGIVAAIIIPALHFFGGVSANWAIGIFVLIVFLLQWGYFALFEAFGNGRTPGKRVARIRVIHQSGRGINFVESLARNLVRFVDYFPGFYAVGVVAIFLSRRNQRLGDMVAGTLVVRDREVDSPHWGESAARMFVAPTLADRIPTASSWSVGWSAAPAGGSARTGAGQAIRLRPRSAGRFLCATPRHGPDYARRASQPHCRSPLRQVGSDDSSGHERGDISRSRRASIPRAGADELSLGCIDIYRGQRCE
jgi:uncharacterized RDD family membrane protein YckC